MDAERTTMKDFRFVMANLSSDFTDEVARAGLSLNQVRAITKSYIKEGTCVTVRHKGEIVALLAHTIHDGAIYTSFPSTERFFQSDVPSAKFGKRYLRELQNSLGNLPILSNSSSIRKTVDRWYNSMGFKIYEKRGKVTIYRLSPV